MRVMCYVVAYFTVMVPAGLIALAFEMNWPVTFLMGFVGGWFILPLADLLQDRFGDDGPGGAR